MHNFCDHISDSRQYSLDIVKVSHSETEPAGNPYTSLTEIYNLPLTFPPVVIKFIKSNSQLQL